MVRVRKAIATCAVTIGTISVAQAADLPRRVMPPPPPVQQATTVVDDNNGWYLRGDLGYRWNMMSGATSTPPFFDPTDSSLGNGYAFGGGMGMKMGWFRGDITLDYSPAVNYTGTVLTAGDVTAKISSITTLVNGYFDLGTWSGFSPYLGVGAGGAYLNVSDYSSLVAPPFGTPAANARWNFAWAAMAGASVALGPRMALDVGYRYLNMGDAATVKDAFGDMTLHSLASHEIRVGVRWTFPNSLF